MKYKGCNGVVKTGVAQDRIIELVSFSIDVAASVLDASRLNDGCNRRVKGGQKSWTGSIDTYLDPDDAGMSNLEVGEIVPAEFYPSGEVLDAGNLLLSGEILITSIATPVETEGSITQSYGFEGNGELTKTEIVSPP